MAGSRQPATRVVAHHKEGLKVMKLNSTLGPVRDADGKPHTFPPGTELPDWAAAKLEGRHGLRVIDEPKKAVPKKKAKK